MGDVAALTWPLTRPSMGPVSLELTSRARRCLFGPVDPDQLRACVEEEHKRRIREDQERWNFDFQAGKPLPPGRYQWIPVSGKDPSDADKNGGSTEETADPEDAANNNTVVRRKEQTHITDFMRKRKSSGSPKDSVISQSKTKRRSST
ncbi:hypothetical protein X975_26974, partial [Stegodyphus mimosarum]